MLEERVAGDRELLAQGQSIGMRARREQRAQSLFAVEVCGAREVVAVEIENVEHVIAKSVLAARLQIPHQLVEPGDAGRIVDDNFAIQHRRPEFEFAQRCGDGGKAVSPVEPLAREKVDIVAIDASLHPVSVELDFVPPFLALRRFVRGRCEHRVDEGAQNGFPRAFHPLKVWQFDAPFRGDVRPTPVIDPNGIRCGQIGVASTRKNGCRLLLHDAPVVRRARVFVRRLDEQPLIGLLARARFHPHKMPSSPQAAPLKFEVEMSFLQSLPRVAEGLPVAAVPDDHRPAAIFAFGNHTLIVEIGKRMVFRPNGKPLDSRNEARPLGDRPAQQRPVEFETKIVVKAPRGMFLDDELRTFPNRRRRRRLRGARKVPPLAVAIEPIRLLF